MIHHFDSNGRHSIAAQPKETPGKKQHDELLISLVKAFLDSGRLPDGSEPTQSWLAKQIGKQPPVISAWLSGTYNGDVQGVEKAIGDCLRNAERRVTDAHQIFETSTTEEMNSTFEGVKKRNRFALVSGPAGVGKSSAIALYSATVDTTCVVFTARKGGGNETAIERGIEKEIASKRNKSRHTRWEFLVDHFKSSNRLIIIDNAHRLTRGGLQWIFDFHDETKCPVCLVGNPEVLEKIRENDQMFSRIRPHVQIDLTEQKKAARKLLEQMIPGHVGELLDEATHVICRPGKVRALRYQIEETLDILEKGVVRDAFKAFQVAGESAVK